MINPATQAFDKCSRFDRQTMMIDIAGNTSAFGQFNDAARNLAVYRPSYADNLTLDTPIHRCGVADRQKIAFDISIYDAINLNIAVRLQIT